MNKWGQASLEEICDVRDGTHDSPKYVKEGYPLITSKNITNGILDFENVSYISEADYNKINQRSFVDDGDILMPMIGTIGNPIIVHKNREFAIKNVALIKFKNSNVLNRYINYCLKSELFAKYVNKENRGGTQKFLSLSNIRKFCIPLPPLDVQKHIADTLDKTQEIIDGYQKQLQELNNLIKATFCEMFGDLDDYEFKPLIELILQGAGLPYGIVQPGDDLGEGIGVLRPLDIKYGEISLDKIKHVSAEIEEPYIRTRLTGNEILITIRGSVGDTALTDEKCIGMNVNRDIAVIRQNDSIVNKIYLNEYLKSEKSQRYIQSHTKGAAIQGINLGTLKELQIPLPPMIHQNKFAQIITNIEQQKSLVKQSITESEALFKSLMSKNFD